MRKNILVVALLMCFCTLSFGQTEIESLDSTVPVPTRIKMNLPEGIKYCAEWGSYWYSNSWSANIYMFNREGFLVRQQVFLDLEEYSHPSGYFVYSYDNKNRLTSCKFYSKKSELVRERTYHYSSDGLAVKIVESSSDDSAENWRYIYSLLYNRQSGLLMAKKCEKDGGTSRDPDAYMYPHTLYYYYDKDGRVVQEWDKAQSVVNKNPNIFVKTEWAYDHNGQLICETVSFFNRNGDDVSDQYYTQTYRYKYDFITEYGLWDKRERYRIGNKGEDDLTEIIYRTYSFYD